MGWKNTVKKSLKSAESVISQMEHAEHCGSRRVTNQDPRAEPYFMAVPLELAAYDVIKNGSDLAGKVEHRVYTEHSQLQLSSIGPCVLSGLRGLCRVPKLDSPKTQQCGRAPPQRRHPVHREAAVKHVDYRQMCTVPYRTPSSGKVPVSGGNACTT
jgi:hypothetical protein